MRHNIDIIVAGIVDATGAQIVWGLGSAYGAVLPTVSGVRTRRDHLLSISALSASIEDDRSIATSGVTTITLPADDGSQLGYRPVDIFSRIGAEALQATDVWSTQGLTAGDTTITMRNDGDASTTYTAPLLLHIGTECIGVTAPNPIGAGWVTCAIDRGLKGTHAHPHRALGSGFLAHTIPVTRYPVTWIGREVDVYVDGQLLRRMMLVSNPTVTTHEVVLQVVGAENKLSVQRSSSYTPTYATTLADYDYQYGLQEGRYWAPIYERAPITVSVSGATPTVSWAYLQTNKILTFAAQDGQLLRQLAPFADGIRQLTRLGGMPAIILTLTAGDTSVELDMGNSGRWYGALSSTQTWEQLAWTASGALTYAAQTARSATIRSVRFGDRTWWNVCEGHDESDGDWADPQVWGTESSSPFAVGWWAPAGLASNAVVLQMRPRFDQRIGFLSPQIQVRAGLIWRRNLAPGEEQTTGQPLVQLGGATDKQPTPIAVTQYLTYPVRPTETGGQMLEHHVVQSRRCQIDACFAPPMSSSTTISIQVVRASTFWERGVPRVMLLQEIPLAADGVVSITWVEPDGTTLSATAKLTRDSARDSGGYCYLIRDVVMADSGEPVVGFGNWPGQPVCQITRPIDTDISAGEPIGHLLVQAIASGDGSSGRDGDTLGDGLDVVLSDAGYASIASTNAGLGVAMRWGPSEDMSYDQLVELGLLLANRIVVGGLDGAGDYSPIAKPASAPMAMEIKATITDDQISGVPASSGAGGQIFTGYKIIAGDVAWTFVDWLAADLLGTGDVKELDLTPLLPDPHALTEEMAAHIVDALRDRFGTLRRRWSMTVPIELAMPLSVGDVVSVTSQYLVAGAGGLGVQQEMARLTSVSLDFRAGTAELEMLAWASYGTGWSISLDVQVSVSSGVWGCRLVEQSARQRADASTTRAHIAIGDTYYLCVLTGSRSGAYIPLVVTGWSPEGVLLCSSTDSGTPPTDEDVCVLMPGSVTGWASQCFVCGRDRLQ